MYFRVSRKDLAEVSRSHHLLVRTISLTELKGKMTLSSLRDLRIKHCHDKYLEIPSLHKSTLCAQPLQPSLQGVHCEPPGGIYLISFSRCSALLSCQLNCFSVYSTGGFIVFSQNCLLLKDADREPNVVWNGLTRCLDGWGNNTSQKVTPKYH